MPDPKPPTGYNLVPRDSSVPSFIRESVGPIKEKIEPPLKNHYPGTETIAAAHPGVISIYDSKEYTPQVRNHEMTHQFQYTRADGNVKLPFGYELPISGASSPSAPMKYTQGSLANYNYGGQDGLQALLSAHKTAANLNVEQQADMVADYKAKQDAYLAKVKAGKATPADLKAMYETHQAYHPFVQQMANVPKNFKDTVPSIGTLIGIGKPQSVATNPAAPGLPSYDTPGLGVAPADPLLGGQSQAIKTPSQKITGTTPNAQTINPVLSQVLSEYPGFSKTFNTGNTSVVFAQGDRAKRGLKERGGLEFWFPHDKGNSDFPSPSPGKNVLEIYSDDLRNNPTALKQAIYGDLMHGMTHDPYWNGLRTQFMQNFTPQELRRQAQHKTWWDDVNGSKDRNSPTYDAYLRGWITNEGEGREGQKKSNDTMYSPKQIQLLQQMENYLKTGNNPTSVESRKAGETKQFGNGKMGVWDGHGWRAK